MPDAQQPERSLADEPQAPAAPSPAAGTTHPLGNPDGTPPPVPAASIVDTILDLDELLSADVRRAEKTARFCTKPWLEADIDELMAQLDMITDDRGVPLVGQEEVAVDLSQRIESLRVEYGQAFRSVRMSQLPADKWAEFKTKHRETLDKGAGFPDAFYDELIAVSALRPAIPLEKVQLLRKQLGDPQMDVLSKCAWDVNAESGVSIPKSPTSSVVLRRARLERS